MSGTGGPTAAGQVIVCIDCRKEIRRTGNRQYRCEICSHEKALKDKRDAAKKRYAEDESVRKQSLESNRKRSYGITPEEYEARLEDQNYSCAICLRHLIEFKRSFDTDHDHNTGEIRGLLCTGCNTGIGNLGDSAERLRAAADYLERRNI